MRSHYNMLHKHLITSGGSNQIASIGRTEQVQQGIRYLRMHTEKAT